MGTQESGRDVYKPGKQKVIKLKLMDELVVTQTKKWITDVVIGCNFCPFAANEVRLDAIRYVVERSNDLNRCLQIIIREFIVMDSDESVATTLIIFPDSFENFDDYLDLVSLAEALLEKEGYEGVYQVASFHPKYLFAGSDDSDAANFTNRSVYPMLHILRESQVERALKKYPGAAKIPGTNIKFAQELGLDKMKMLRNACFAVKTG